MEESELQRRRNYQRSRSFSCMEDLRLIDDELISADEEKMDMLWEDFNEELARISGDGEQAGENNGLDFSKTGCKLEGMMKLQVSRELFCVKAVRRRPRPGLVMILKVFKKLLLVQNSRKKRTASSLESCG